MGSNDVVETVRYKLKGSNVRPFDLVVNMQDMTKEICDAARVNDVKEGVVDLRDGNTYNIAKLADGKCWMTQNLNLKLNADTLPLRSVDPEGKGRESDVSNWNPGSSWYTVNGISNNTSDTGTLSWNNGNGHGTYWQWNAATAGQGNSVTGSEANTTQSVCPKGWRLPTSGYNTGEFKALYDAYSQWYGLKNWTKAPAWFTYSGFVYSGSLGYVGSEGRYWSSTSSNSAGAYSLNFNSSGIYPSTAYTRRFGYSVRCVAR